MRSESWLRLMSGLVLVGVFAAGTLFGAGLMKWTAPPGQRLPAPPHGGPIMAMQRELALTEAQMIALRAIAAAHQQALDAIARATQEDVRKVLFAIEDELAKVLTVEQQSRLADWRKHRRPPPPPPGMGPPPGGPPPGGPP
jgi:Spy/CpxP family protein refolding chaperone